MRLTQFASHLKATTALTQASAVAALAVVTLAASIPSAFGLPASTCTVSGSGTAGNRSNALCNPGAPPTTTLGTTTTDYYDIVFEGGTVGSKVNLIYTNRLRDNNTLTFKSGYYGQFSGGVYSWQFYGAGNSVQVQSGADLDLTSARGFLYNWTSADNSLEIQRGAKVHSATGGIEGILPSEITINGTLSAGSNAAIEGSADTTLGTTISIGAGGLVENTSASEATISTASNPIASLGPSTQGPVTIVVNGTLRNNSTGGAAINLTGGYTMDLKVSPDADTGAVVTVGPAGRIVGTSLLTTSNDGLYLYPGATITAAFDAGDGSDVLGLIGTTTGSFDLGNSIYQNFESLQKSGTGTWYLTGTGTFSEATLSAGTLEVNGTLNAPLEMDGGTLRGTGTINGGLTMTGSTLLSPGSTQSQARSSSLGTLNVTGTTRFSANSTFLVEIDADGSADRLAITGRAALDGRVRVNAGSGTYADGDEWTILTASAGYSGTFSGGVSFVPGTAIAGTAMNILYRGNSVILQLAVDDDDDDDGGCTGTLNDCDNVYIPDTTQTGSGNTIDGGNGTDTLTLTGATNFGATVRNFEHLVVDQAQTNINFESDLNVDSTTIDGGLLRFNGTLTSPVVNVNTGGTLGGRGTINGDITTNNGGAISPGNSIDTLTVNGNTRFAAGSTLVAEIAPDGSADKLVVSGRTTIEDTARIRVVATSDTAGSYALGDTFTVVESGTRAGAFDTVVVSDPQSLLRGMRVTALHEGGDVLLQLMPTRFRPAALNTPAAIAAGRGLDRAEAAGATGDMATVINSLWGLRYADLQNELSRIHPEWVDAHAETALTHLPQVRGALGQRLAVLRGQGGGGGVAASGVAPRLTDIDAGGAGSRTMGGAAPSAGLVAGLTGGSRDLATIGGSLPELAAASRPETGGPLGFWVAGVGDLRSLDAERNHLGYDVMTRGAVAGVDKRFSDSLIAGISLSAVQSDIDHDGDRRDDEQRSYLATAYAQQTFGAWFAQADASFGVTRHDSERLTALGRAAKASWDGWQLGAAVSGGTALTVGDGWTLTPTATLGLDHLHQDAFTETGAGALNLNVGGRDDTQLGAGIKAEVSRSFTSGDALITPAAALGARVDVPLGGRTIDANLTGGGSRFTVDGRGDAEVVATPALSLSVDFRNGVSLFGGYQGEFGKETTAHGARAGLLVTW